MLNFIIKSLEKLLVYLKNIQEKHTIDMDVDITEKKVSKKSIFGMIVLFLVPAVSMIFMSFIFIHEIVHFFYGFKILLYILLLILFVGIFICFLRNFSKKFLFLVYFPFIISFIFIFGILGNLFQDRDISGQVYTLLLGVFPWIYILKHYFTGLKSNKIVNIISSIGFNYNIAYFFLLSFNTSLLILGVHVFFFDEVSRFISEIVNISNYYNGGFSLLEYLFSGIFVLLSTFAVLFYPIYTLNMYFDRKEVKKINIHKGFLYIFIIFICIFISNSRGYVYDEIIQSAKINFQEEGFNEKTYDNTNQFLLERAFLYKIKNNQNIDQELFKKVFDTTPVGLYGEKIEKYLGSSNSFATNISKVGDKAEVVFELADIENNFILDKNSENNYLLETTYNFYFENQTTTNQEVIINFETPSKYSVVTDLFLGLNSELVGQISPRGAARKVYEDSLRRNTDPALIEKVGLNTYNLRIFPIPSKSVKQGKQKVVVKILSPVLSEDIITTPKFSIINLKFNDSSRIIVKNYKDGKLKKEDILKTPNDIQEFISQDQLMKISDIGFKNDYKFQSSCLDYKLYQKLLINNVDINQEKNIGNKIHVFFDNSNSVKRNNTHKIYGDIFRDIKNHENKLQDLDIYSFNFTANKLSDVSDIEFWGYSNMDGFIDYLVANNIENQNIIFVTDDDSFEFNSKQVSSYYSNNISSNKLSVIKIGNNIKSYKSEFHTLLSMSEGNIYEVNNSDEIPQVISKILSQENKELVNICQNYTVNNTTDNLNKIYAGIVSSKLLSKLSQNNISILDSQNFIAKEYHIVNQFNSLIALETQRQQNDLDRYSKQTDKYNLDYNIGGNAKNLPGSTRTSVINFDNANIVNSDLSIQGSMGSENISFGKVGNINYSSGYYNKKIEINFLGFLLILIYIGQIISFVSFVSKYFHRK